MGVKFQKATPPMALMAAQWNFAEFCLCMGTYNHFSY